jgi:hypothetical protein
MIDQHEALAVLTVSLIHGLSPWFSGTAASVDNAALRWTQRARSPIRQFRGVAFGQSQLAAGQRST